MRPDELTAQSFALYPVGAREFAIEHLSLLQHLPLMLCPSFLKQIQQWGTSFPAEQASLRWQCDFLTRMAPEQFADLVAPFEHITMSAQLEASDWVHAPAIFITDLSANLWLSGQINQFRVASLAFFAAIPEVDTHPHRLTIVVVGRDAPTAQDSLFRKLKRRGVALTALDDRDMPGQIRAVFRNHARQSQDPYAHWYVDGGDAWTEEFGNAPQTIRISYPALSALRERTLSKMEHALAGGSSGAEEMRTRLSATTPQDVDAAGITSDPVLQRFYTELFTESSGPQFFSTSFVQWAGRELARRAQPQTLLLRYAPRQAYRTFDQLTLAPQADRLDPEGSLRDADMGAWYAWIEMNRITRRGKGTFFAWLEGSRRGVLIGNAAPAGTVCDTSLTLDRAVADFG